MDYEPKQFLRGFAYNETQKTVYVITTGDVELPTGENLTQSSFSHQKLNAVIFDFYIQVYTNSTTNRSWDQRVPVMTDIQYQTNPQTTSEKIEDIRTQIAAYLELKSSFYFIIYAVVKKPDGSVAKKGSSNVNSSGNIEID